MWGLPYQYKTMNAECKVKRPSRFFGKVFLDEWNTALAVQGNDTGQCPMVLVYLLAKVTPLSAATGRLLAAVAVFVVPVQIEKLVALLHGAAGVQIVGQLLQYFRRLQTLDVKFRQGFFPHPQA